MTKLIQPSAEAEAVFEALVELNPNADMRAVPNQWVLNERGRSAELNEQIYRLRAENEELKLRLKAVQVVTHFPKAPWMESA